MLTMLGSNSSVEAGVVVKDDFPFCFLAGQPGGTQCFPVPLTEENLTVLSTLGGSKMP